MQIDEQTYKKMPPHLQALFVKDPNPARDEVVGMFPHTKSGKIEPHHVRTVETTMEVFGKYGKPSIVSHGDQGSAARFFYSAKASKADRNGSKHPTVKPIALMEWLATLITPPGGVVLDPFAGSGTTGIAAQNKGFRVILCERESEYVRDIKARFGTPPATRLPIPLALERLRAELALQPLVAALRARLGAAA